MGLQTSGDPSPPDETKVLPPGFNHFVTCPDRKQKGDVILDDAEDYSSVWESLPASSRPVSGALRPEWEADAELATSFEWQRHLEADNDRDSTSGTMPKSPGPGQIQFYSLVHYQHKFVNCASISAFISDPMFSSLFYIPEGYTPLLSAAALQSVLSFH